ncbi:MAG: DUF4280 domain-containing protein [Planctomycetes bacterium]|nr:DUF4280 domain-containing protein [Planctomycetota bacterium]
MGVQVVATAMMSCSFGAAPSTLSVIPAGRPLAGGLPAANITDMAPMVNIPPFGMCNTPSNPTVASATAAALGVLTPMPCVPVTTAPWAPGCATVLVSGMPALNNSSKCMCAWGGVISITNPGQTTTMVP